MDGIRPVAPAGLPAKATVGQPCTFSVDLLEESRSVLRARVVVVQPDRATAEPIVVELVAQGNDSFSGWCVLGAPGMATFRVEAWIDTYSTWLTGMRRKVDAGTELLVDFEDGVLELQPMLDRALAADQGDLARQIAELIQRLRDAGLNSKARIDTADQAEIVAAGADIALARVVERSDPFELTVERARAGCGAWYELFPRSYGGFAGTMHRLPAIADMGFDVLYLPPIHPIGTSHRKGRHGDLRAGPEDPGSPWAIGGPDGGHKAIHKDLGTEQEFRELISLADRLGLEIALDLAFQCSPDHPWVTEHPEWFRHRSDGSIAYAENPPKRYQDIVPLNFWPDREADRIELWGACLDVALHWAEVGIRIFRVDNPHTKPLAFWQWFVSELRARVPDVILLAEAFTVPKMMAALAAVGFSQSYTYFTWRSAPQELAEYVEELANGPLSDYFRPNFWPNTPDILAGPLRLGSRNVFKQRLILAATLAGSYGIYSGYELMENQPASDDNEEYFDSEKFTIRDRDWDASVSLAPFIARLNAWRRRHPSLHTTQGTRFIPSSNDRILAYHRTDVITGDHVIVVVNCDPDNLGETSLSFASDEVPITVTDELTGETYSWESTSVYIRLDPNREPAHLLSVRAFGRR
jgi:starch synthase (maltosyl-transferring)